MNKAKEVPAAVKYIPSNNADVANPVLVSRQIDGLREVLRRLKASRSETVDAVMSEKLKRLARS